MKEKFERLMIEIVALEDKDIITTSNSSETVTPGENEGPFVPA